jgi:hypothetical protein
LVVEIDVGPGTTGVDGIFVEVESWHIIVVKRIAGVSAKR